MAQPKLSIFFVFGTLCLMLSLAFVCNAVVGADAADDARDSCSDALCSFVIPEQADNHGTLMERFGYAHDEYFGLRG